MRKEKEAPMKISKKIMEAQKAIRVLPEIEPFYTFIHENSLRDEAKILIQSVLENTSKKRTPKSKVLQ